MIFNVLAFVLLIGSFAQGYSKGQDDFDLGQGKKLTLNGHNLCLKLLGKNVAVWDCRETTQKWIFTLDGKIRTAYADKCLNIDAFPFAKNGSNVFVDHCKTAPEWSYQDDQKICLVSDDNYCLSVNKWKGKVLIGNNVELDYAKKVHEEWFFSDESQSFKVSKTTVGRKIRLLNSRNHCLDVEGVNATANGTNVGIYNCNEVTETWVYDKSSGKISLGYASNKCLTNEKGAYGDGYNIFIDDCSDAAPWRMKADGKICARWNRAYCLDINGHANYGASGDNVHLWHRDLTDELWSFDSYSPRTAVQGERRVWKINIYGNNNYPNKSNKLQYHLNRVWNMFHYYWEYMPAYLKKHAINGPPDVRTYKYNWDDERAKGAPEISLNASQALRDFGAWMDRSHSPRPLLNFYVFIRWNLFDGEVGGQGNIGTSAPQNFARKDSVASLRPQRNVMAHEIGHNLGLQHYNHRCRLPGVGRRYSFMHYSRPQQDDAIWYGPLPCQEQDQVKGFFYQLAFGDFSVNWNSYSITTDVSYNKTEDALVLSRGSQLDYFLNDGGDRLLAMGATGFDYVYANGWKSDPQEGRLGLFTVIERNGLILLMPDDPIAYRFKAYHKSHSSVNIRKSFRYHRRK